MAVPALRQALRAKSVEVRAAASGALMNISSPSAVPDLVAATEDTDPHVRSNAIFALANLFPESALPVAIDALSDPFPRVRVGAACFLENLGSKARAALPAIERARREFPEDRSRLRRVVFSIRFHLLYEVIGTLVFVFWAIGWLPVRLLQPVFDWYRLRKMARED